MIEGVKMRYVAFDIESANSESGVVSDICEFGYMIADENFCIKDKKSIKIRPRRVGKWNEDNHGIKMEDYELCPEFRCVYPIIKKLLEHHDQMLFAHDAQKDLAYLGRECRRNELDAPQIEVYDTKKIWEKFKNPMSGKTNLKEIAESMGIKLEGHRPDEDSEACLYIPKTIFEEIGKEKFQILIEEYKDTIVKTQDTKKELDKWEQHMKNEKSLGNQTIY